jgi:hypothetical protein
MVMGLLACLVVPGEAMAAGRPTAAEVALMPVPIAQLGHLAPALPVAQDSGVVTNTDAAGQANAPVSPATVTQLGRVTGYQLDYGSAISGRAGVREVDTTVDLYRSAAAAGKGFVFWRKDEVDASDLRAAGIGVSVSVVRTAGVGPVSFGDVGVLRLRGNAPIYGADVMFQTGSFVAKASVSASRSDMAQPLVAEIARQLLARIHSVLVGAITGPRVTLPALHPTGPSLEGLALTRADLAGSTVKQQGYRIDKDLNPEAEYVRELVLPGIDVNEEIDSFPSPSAASYAFAVQTGVTSTRLWQVERDRAGLRDFTPHSIAVHVGQASAAVVGTAQIGHGQTVFVAFICIRTGRTTEFVTVVTADVIPLTAANVSTIARAAAQRAQTHVPRGLTA